MHDTAKQPPPAPISCTVTPRRPIWRNLHANISRLIMSDSRGKAAVRNHTGAKMDSDLHVPGRLLAWLHYEIQMIKMTQFPPGCVTRTKKKSVLKKVNCIFRDSSVKNVPLCVPII